MRWKGRFRSNGAKRAANGAVGTRGAGWGGLLPDARCPVPGALCQPGRTIRVGCDREGRASDNGERTPPHRPDELFNLPAGSHALRRPPWITRGGMLKTRR